MKSRIIIFVSIVFLALNAQSQVTVHINSGNPRYPFPQFLPYLTETGISLDNLGTKNADGVVHAEMEQDIRDAYQIFANEWEYTGESVNGVKYIRGNIGCPYDCREGDGYSLLAAAVMGDKVSFDGLWLRVHDKARVKQVRYIDGAVFEPTYAYGDYALKDNANSATDGDVDIALALYVAWMQWGDNMGINDIKGNPISYRKEMIDVIRGLVALSTRFPTENPQRNNSGEIGFDGYMKNGDTWTEITNWASQPANYYLDGGISKYPEYGGPQAQHTDYSAPAYFREFHDLLDSLVTAGTGESSAWEAEQYRRAEASSDWMVGNWIGQAPKNIFLGETATVSTANVVALSAGNQGGRFRSTWRTALNYVWHGNPTYTWNPTTHKVVSGGNTFELNASKQMAGYMNSPQDWGGAACTDFGGGPTVTYKGPSTIQWDVNPNGTSVASAFTLNWVPGCGTASAVAAQDLDLLGLLYRQCSIEWDVDDAGDGYLTSDPHYFHGWFRLLGMLVASGQMQAPSKMLPKANMKIYRSLKDSLSYAYTGDEVTYYLDYRNYGSVDASNVKIVEYVPDDFLFVSATKGGVYNAATHTVTWTIGTVPGFKTGSLDVTKGQVSYVAKIGPLASGRYCTTAQITCSNGYGWTSNEYPNFITATMQRNCVDVIKRSLVIEKTANLEQVNPGNVVTYTIKFENSSEAGWLDGGRPRVGISFANTLDDSQNWLKFRLYNDAIEPYINYGNYRISYYFYDSNMKCLSGDSGCTTGWGWYTAIYEGKRTTSDKVSVSHETVVEGSDGYGKWNQRMMIQFAPLLVTTTAHLSNYYGMSSRIHRGGTEPLRVAGYMFPSNRAATDYTDDWSYDAKAKDGDGGNYFPVTPSWQEIDPTTGKSIEKVINEYIPSVCETPAHTVPNILVEEYDGYAWRRVLGTGPMAGRDAENVVIVDTLPKGLSFVAFQNTCPLATSGATWTKKKAADGRDIVMWAIPYLQIKQKGSIIYTATATFPSGATCQTADETIDNLAWIYADLNSPIADTATVTVTCAKVPAPIVPTTLSKTPSVETASTGDNVTYTLNYKQTHGSIFKNAGATASDWTLTNATVSGGKVSLASYTTTSAKFKNSYALNSYTTLHADFSTYSSAEIYFRDDLTVSVRTENATIIVTCKDNGTTLKSASINSGGATSFDLIFDVTDDILRMWVDKDTTNSADFTAVGAAKTAGYFGFISLTTSQGSAAYSNINYHSDYAYNLSIVDELPTELTYVSSNNSGVHSGSKVTWTFEQGFSNPIPFGKEYTVSVTTKVNSCSEKIINVAHVELFGHAVDEIQAQAVVKCGASAPDAPTVTTPVTYCQGDAAVALKATGTSLKWYSASVGGSGASSAPIPSTVDAVTTKYYVSQTVGGVESARAVIEVVVNAKPSVPSVANGGPFCVGNALTLSVPAMASATYAWTGPNGFISTDQNPTVSASATLAMAGDYSLVVTSAKNCASNPGTTTVVVNKIPDAPIVTTPITYCQGEAPTQLSATGTGLSWYTVATGGTALATAPTPVTTTVADVSYFVSQIVSGCESSRAKIVVSTIAPPSTPTVTTNSPVCVGKNIELTTALVPSATYSWSGPNSFMSTDQNPTLVAATAAAGTYSLKVKVGNCTSAAGTAMVIVNENPQTPVPTSNGPVCDGQEIKLSVPTIASATYAWSGPNAFTSALQNPTTTASTTTAGEYSLTVTVSGCTSAAGKTTVVVNSIPAMPTATTPIQYCKNETAVILSATGTSLKWYATATSTTSSTIAPTPSTTAVADVSYYVTQTVIGCESPRKEIVVSTLEPPTIPTITTNSPVCAGSKITLGTSAVGTYQWTGPNSFTSTEQNPTITAVEAAEGTYSLVVKVGNCSSAAGTTSVVVNPVPTASIDAVANLCVDASNVTLKATPSPTGGTGAFSGTGVSGSTFSPSTAGKGTHTITYTYTVNGCDTTKSIDITVQAKSLVSFVLPTTTCKSSSTIALSGNPTGGTFTATPSLDLSSGFNPSLANTDVAYTITYTYSDGVCSNTTTNPITVYDPVKPVGTNASAVYSKVTSSTIPALTATGENLVWYSDAALTTEVGTGAIYTPAAAEVIDGAQGKVGVYTYYVVSTKSGCVSEKTAVTLEITACEAEVPVPTSNLVEVCFGETNAALKQLAVTAGTGNIRWYYNNAIVQDDPATTYIPTVTAAGTYTFDVSLYDNTSLCESPKATITYKINTLPTVSFSLPASVCEGSSVIDFTTYKSQAAGVVTDASSAVVTSFNPTTAGSNTFTYSYTDANNCTNTANSTIKVNALPTITPTAVPNKCEYDAMFDLTSYAAPTGGTFSGSGVTSSKNFTPSAVTAGVSTNVIYTYTDGNNCKNIATLPIMVYAAPVVTVNPVPAVCIGSAAFDLKQYVSPNTGTFVGDHMTGTSFDPQVDGSYSITYTVLENGCSTDKQVSVKVNELPTVDLTVNPVECVNTGVASFVASPAGGTLWIDNNTATEINTNNLSAGNYTISYSYKNPTTGCSDSVSEAMGIREIAMPTVQDKSVVMTSTDLSITATGNGGVLVWTDENGVKTTAASITHPSSAVAGSWQYCVTETDGTCTSDPACMTFSVVDCPTPAPTVTPLTATICEQDPMQTFTVTATGNVSWYYNGTKVSTDVSFTPSYTDAGTYKWLVTDYASGCEGVPTEVTLVINQKPEITITNTDKDFCVNDSQVAIKTTTDIAGGTFNYSGETVSGGNFNPANATTKNSPITITVNYQTAEGCTDQTTAAFVVHTVNALTVTSPITQLESDYETVLNVTPIGTNTVKWYDACDTKNQLGTGNSFSTGLTGLASENFGVTQTDSYGCESECATIQVNRISCPTPAPTVNISYDEICATETVPTFTASGAGTINWYNGTTLLQHENDFTPTAVEGKAGTYTWTVTQTSTGENACEGVAATVTLKIHPNPEIPVSVPSVICKNGANVTPTTNLSGTSFTFNGNSITNIVPSQYAAGTYTLAYSYNDPVTGCPAVESAKNCYTSACLNKEVEIREIVSPSVDNVTKLITDTDFTIPVSSPNAGYSYQWKDSINNVVGTTATLTHPYDIKVGKWNYCVTASDGTCTSEKSCMTFSIINCPVPKPTVNNPSIIGCTNQDMPILETGGDYTIRWYKSTDLNTIIATGSQYTPTDIISAGKYVYSVTQYDGTCEGLPATVTLEMQTIPAPTISGNKTVCENEELPLAADKEVYWYSSTPATSNYDEVSTAHTVSYAAAGSYDLWMVRKETYCSSNSVHLTVKVNAIPDAPAITVANVCAGSNVDFTATGTDIKWYNNAIQVSEGATYSIPSVPAGTVQISATQTVEGCTSSEAQSSATVYEIPSAPTATDVTICEYNNIEPIIVNSQSGAVTSWYGDESHTQIVATGTTHTPTEKVTQTYYVTQTVEGCESPSATVNFTVISKPEDVKFKQTNDIVVCEGNSVVIIAESANTIYWYDNKNGKPIFTGRYYTIPTTEVGEYTYYATQTDATGCVSDMSSKKVIIQAGPTAAIIVKQDTICEYEEPGRLIVSRTSENEIVSWISPSGATLSLGDTLDVPQNLIKAPGVYNFKARTTVASCSYDTRKETIVKYVVYPKPANPTLNKDAFCYDGSPVTLSTSAQSPMWYGSNGNLLSADSPTYATMYSEAGNYSVQLTQMINGCVSDTTIVPFLISAIPTPEILGKNKLCANVKETYVVTKSDEKNQIDWKVTGNKTSYEISRYNTGFVRDVDWGNEGFDTIYVTETNQYSCVGKKEMPVEVISAPDVSFTAETLGQEGVVTFTNTSECQIVRDNGVEKEYHVDYFWDFGRNIDTVLVLQNSKTFEREYKYGDHTAELTAVNEFGCTSVAKEGFFVDVEHGLFVPTAFAPNSPSEEVRIFKPKGFNCRTFEIWIYDAWNNLVYYSSGVGERGVPLAEWDGMVNGKLMQAGTYRYKIEVTFEDHSEDNLKIVQTVKPIWGNVVLIR